MPDKTTYDALDAKFKTAPVTVPEPQVQAVPAVQKNLIQVEPAELIDDDFEQARNALKDMVKKGQTAVDDIMGIARQSDHPRAFEVVGQLIKTTAETAKDLLALQKQKKELTAVPQSEGPKQIGTQNNIVFSGSTNDLLKLLKNKDEKVIDDAANTED